MRYKFNKGTDKELEIYSSVYLPNIKKMIELLYGEI